MATGGAQFDAERKEACYLRLHLLLVKKGTEVMRARFDYAIPPLNLHKELQNCIKTTRYGLNNNHISQAQFNRLYPKQGPPKSENFDISLLCYLLRNICHLNVKSNWWNVVDNSKIPENEHSEEADIQRIKNMRNVMQHMHVASLEDTDFEAYWDIMEKAMSRLAAKCNITDMKEQLDELKSAKLDIVTDKFRTLRELSKYFLEDFQDEHEFVETSTFRKAKQVLANKNIVILTGCPGEGKTTMAARLALTLSKQRNCLKLSMPSDWDHIDLSLKLIDMVIIDDIFGAGALDQRSLGEWRSYLHQIENAAKNKAIRVIITSRHYILKESLDEIGSLQSFKKENETVVQLSSADLTDGEKSSILRRQSIRNLKEIPEHLVRACVEASRGPTKENPDFLFGFPECASMFIRSKEMFRQGAVFFKRPSLHFKSYLEVLYTNEKAKFLALVSVWAKENKRLARAEMRNRKTVSEHIKRVAEVFDHDINREFLDMLKSSLDFHVGDYLVFDEKREEYAFSHNVIGDMVGLVIGKKKPEETVEICPRDFLMEYVSIDGSSNDDFKLVLKEIHIACLAEKCINMLLRNKCNIKSKNPENDEFNALRRVGKRSNAIKTYHTLDFGIIKHKAFSSQMFVKVFIDMVISKRCIAEVFQVPVMQMKGYFLDYGIKMKEQTMCLMAYAWFSGASTFAKAVITREILGNENFDPSMSLLFAIQPKQRDSKQIESVEFLLSHGARVTGDVIYIAMHHKQPALLDLLLQYPGTDVNDRGNAVNGNYPLIVAAREGMIESVRCLLKNGADPGVKNSVNMTALHKAIIYKHETIVQLLLKAKAPLNIKGGKFKRTPIHLAADINDLDLAKQLVKNGVSLNVKDYRGHFPIHIAAIRGHVNIVRFLLRADPSQDKWRISSYGSKSMIKGMSLFHVAVWRKNFDLMDALIKEEADPNIQDLFGQTPLFYAIIRKEEIAVEQLLAYPKTDKRKTQKQGYTPLHAAIHKGLTKIAINLAKVSDVNARDNYGRTALHVACETSNFPMVFYLVAEYRSDPRAVTNKGDTVFHILKTKNQNASRQAELFLTEWDPDFVARLPNLPNKKGIIVNITIGGRRSGTEYWRMLVQYYVAALQTRSRSAIGNRSSADSAFGVRAIIKDFRIDSSDDEDACIGEYEQSDMYDEHDDDNSDEFDEEDDDLF